MARPALTGTRIRERRLMLGVRQADLARQAGISASYLNLIEHNRRKIGGKLLIDIARHLGVESSALTQGAEAALLQELREAAVGHEGAGADLPRIEEFIGRFPGWAQLLADSAGRIARLERTVERLTDRMAHDPHLAASLHELLSTVTAISSTASILVETDDIDPEWQSRFHRNIHEESQRLTEGAQALVSYLDTMNDDAGVNSSPQEELEAFLRGTGYHIAGLEREEAPSTERLLDAVPELVSAPARALARDYLQRYRQDARQMPLQDFVQCGREHAWDPGAVARALGMDLTAVFRRMAALPLPAVGFPIGLVICDASGTLTFRKPIEGFALPRFGAACPRWPLYQALSRPVLPIRARIEAAGRIPQHFVAYAICQPQGRAGFDDPQVLEAAMLLMPDREGSETGVLPALQVGASCRICPVQACPARREVSILRDGF